MRALVIAALALGTGGSCADRSPAGSGKSGGRGGTGGVATAGTSTTRAPDAWTVLIKGQDGVNDIAWHAFDAGPTGDVLSRHMSEGAWAGVLAIAQPPLP